MNLCQKIEPQMFLPNAFFFWTLKKKLLQHYKFNQNRTGIFWELQCCFFSFLFKDMATVNEAFIFCWTNQHTFLLCHKITHLLHIIIWLIWHVWYVFKNDFNMWNILLYIISQPKFQSKNWVWRIFNFESWSPALVIVPHVTQLPKIWMFGQH